MTCNVQNPSPLGGQKRKCDTLSAHSFFFPLFFSSLAEEDILELRGKSEEPPLIIQKEELGWLHTLLRWLKISSTWAHDVCMKVEGNSDHAEALSWAYEPKRQVLERSWHYNCEMYFQDGTVFLSAPLWRCSHLNDFYTLSHAKCWKRPPSSTPGQSNSLRMLVACLSFCQLGWP